MHIRTLVFSSLIVLLVVIGLIIYVNNNPVQNSDSENPAGKPGSPFSVSMEVKSESGLTKTLSVTVKSEVGLPKATLKLISFEGLQVISPTPIEFVLVGGETRTFDVEIKLSPSAGGICTAEVEAKFGDGTVFVENAAIPFFSGRVGTPPAFKAELQNNNRVKVQDVPVE